MLERVESRTVVWLNETQLYLLTGGSDQGQRVVARLRRLLADDERAPVLVLGTMWPEYWHTLTRRPRAGEPDPHAQARELLAGTYIAVAKSFDQTVVDALRASNSDPRLVEAATRAEGGELAQYLAGAPALLARYETAPDAAKALLNAAMDLRRLGHGPALPLGLLETITPGYLTDGEWNSLQKDWFSSALRYSEQRCDGAHFPLTRIRARPGQPATNQPHYRLADYLEQTGRQRRRRHIVPSVVWQELAARVEKPVDAGQLGQAAAARLLDCHAIPLLLRAAGAGDESAAVRLADLLSQRGDMEGLRARADAGDEYAAVKLASLLAERGDDDGAIAVLRTLADAGGGYAARRLAQLLAERGDHDGAIAVLRAPADAGDGSAAERLAGLLVAHDQSITELWARADAGDGSAARLLAFRLAKRGDLEDAIAVRRTPADAGSELANKMAAGLLAELLAERGDLEELRTRAATGGSAAFQRPNCWPSRAAWRSCGAGPTPATCSAAGLRPSRWPSGAIWRGCAPEQTPATGPPPCGWPTC